VLVPSYRLPRQWLSTATTESTSSVRPGSLTCIPMNINERRPPAGRWLRSCYRCSSGPRTIAGASKPRFRYRRDRVMKNAYRFDAALSTQQDPSLFSLAARSRHLACDWTMGRRRAECREASPPTWPPPPTLSKHPYESVDRPCVDFGILIR